MNRNKMKVVLSAAAALAGGGVMMAQAQDVLPRPEQPFKGHIGRKAKDSIRDFP